MYPHAIHDESRTKTLFIMYAPTLGPSKMSVRIHTMAMNVQLVQQVMEEWQDGCHVGIQSSGFTDRGT